MKRAINKHWDIQKINRFLKSFYRIPHNSLQMKQKPPGYSWQENNRQQLKTTMSKY